MVCRKYDIKVLYIGQYWLRVVMGVLDDF